MTLLSPPAGLVGLAAALPLLALALASRARARAARELGVAPQGTPRLVAASAVATPLLLALAAMQPAIASERGARVRTDAAAAFVVDVSRSMLASGGGDGATRIDQARAAAVDLRDAVPQLRAGVATLTDRVLPDLLPSADRSVFAATVRRAVGVDRPPPQSIQPVVTTFEPLGGLTGTGYFPPHTRRRIVVLLTDGETEPYDAAAVAGSLGGARLLVVRVGSPADRIRRADGSVEAAYRALPGAAAETRRLAAAAGGRAIDAGDLAPGRAWLRAAAGSGPTARAGTSRNDTPLAPYLALAACVAALPLLRRGLRWLGV